MVNWKLIIFGLLAILSLVACQSKTMADGISIRPETESGSEQTGMGGMGHDPGMHARHMARIPTDYAGKRNPVVADDASLEKGKGLFSTNCASCHGEDGSGNGPAGVSLDPRPSPVAQTGRMMGDDYLFWRISEGGNAAPFNSAMPPWKDVLDENARWNVINYLRVMGSEQFSTEAESAQREEVLAQAVEQGVISQEEADIFQSVHTALDLYAEGKTGGFTGRMEDVQAQWLEELVEAGELSQADVDTFNKVHERLLEAGLMP